MEEKKIIKTSTLNIKYAPVQGFYWMLYGVTMSFASVFLLSKGYDNGEIGIILALGNIFAVILQSPIASAIDRAKKISLSQVCIGLIALICALAGCLCMMKTQHLFVGVAFVMSATTLMILQPLVNSIGMFYINKGYPINFGVTRGIGSVSYAVIMAIMGFMIDGFGIIAIPVGMIGLCIGFIIIVLWNNTNKNFPPNIIDCEDGNRDSQKTDSEHDKTLDTSEEEPITLLEFAKKYKRFMIMLLGIILIFFNHNALNMYMYQIVEHVGGTSADVGVSLSISATAELPTMFGFAWLIHKWKGKTLLRVSALGFAIKAVVFVLATNVTFIHFAQVLQMFGYALFTPTVIFYVNQLVHRADAVKGQALTTTAIAIGGVVGSFIGGQMLDLFGVTQMLIIGAACAIVGGCIVCTTVEG